MPFVHSGDFQCPDNSLKCPGSYCIPLRFRCNDVWDCANGEDELKCGKFLVAFISIFVIGRPYLLINKLSAIFS